MKGQAEPANIAINKPSKNALIDAFGDDTTNWIDKLLTLHVETAIISGKRGVALYLVPEGFEVKEDAGGYVVVTRIGENKPQHAPGTAEEDMEISPEDIPF